MNFSELLKRPAGEAKRPPPLPAGNYPGVVKSWEPGESAKQKTPFVRFILGFTGQPDDADPADFTDIDLSKKQTRRDFYLTEDALYRLDEFIASCGIDAAGRAYEEVLPEVIGANVLMDVTQRMGQDNEIYNDVGNLVGA